VAPASVQQSAEDWAPWPARLRRRLDHRGLRIGAITATFVITTEPVGLGKRADALEAEIDLGGVGVAVIRAGLARFPAGDRNIPSPTRASTRSICFWDRRPARPSS